MPAGYVMPCQVPSHPAPARPSLALRGKVWLRRFDLDTQLATGANPARGDELWLRAAQLRDPAERAKLAAAFDQLLMLAHRRSARATLSTRAPFRAQQILAHRQLLSALAERLRDGRVAPLRGLATSALLIQRVGLLSADPDPAALERAIFAALSALEGGENGHGYAAPPDEDRAEAPRRVRMHGSPHMDGSPHSRVPFPT